MVLSATSHGLGIRLGMALVYPVQQWGVATRGAHTLRLPDVLLSRSFVCNSRKKNLGILPRRKKISKTRNKMLQFAKFV